MNKLMLRLLAKNDDRGSKGGSTAKNDAEDKAEAARKEHERAEAESQRLARERADREEAEKKAQEEAFARSNKADEERRKAEAEVQKTSDTEMFFVPKAFRLTLEDRSVVEVKAGAQRLPKKIGEHWFAKAHGVRQPEGVEGLTDEVYDEAARDVVNGNVTLDYAVKGISSHFKTTKGKVLDELEPRVERLQAERDAGKKPE